MKALEERIQKIIEDNIYVSWVNEEAGVDSTASEDIAKEVKDIAIEFSKYFFAESLRNLEASKDWSELFDQFIKQKYATP